MSQADEETNKYIHLVTRADLSGLLLTTFTSVSITRLALGRTLAPVDTDNHFTSTYR